MKRSQLGAMLLCILISCSVAFGQATTSLRGTVKDPSGALIPNATISITDQTVNKTIEAVTNARGEYQFPQIPPAKYIITVSAQGLGSQSKSAELLVNQPATIDFSLSRRTLQALSLWAEPSFQGALASGSALSFISEIAHPPPPTPLPSQRAESTGGATRIRKPVEIQLILLQDEITHRAEQARNITYLSRLQ